MNRVNEFPDYSGINLKTDLINLKNFDMKVNQSTGATADFTLPDNYSGSKTSKYPIWNSTVSADAATINLVPVYKNEVYAQAVGQAMTINIATTYAELGDQVLLKLANDGTARTVTFGTGIKASATVVGTINKTINVLFMFDGTNYVEVTRSAAYTP